MLLYAVYWLRASLRDTHPPSLPLSPSLPPPLNRFAVRCTVGKENRWSRSREEGLTRVSLHSSSKYVAGRNGEARRKFV